MNKVRALITILPLISIIIAVEYFPNPEKPSHLFFVIIVFQISLCFSFFMDSYLAQLQKAEELDKKGKLIRVYFLNKKRFIISLITSSMISIIVSIVSYTISLNYIFDFFIEDNLLSLESIISNLFILLFLYLCKSFANLIYNYLK